MKRIIIFLFLILFRATFISGQEETTAFKRNPGINFGIGPGLYISSFQDRNKSTSEPYQTIKVSSEGQTTYSMNGIMFFEFPLSSHFSIQLEISFASCNHEMNYVYSITGNQQLHDTGDYILSYFNTQLSLLFSFNRGNRFRYFFGPFLNIPFNETCTGKESKTQIVPYVPPFPFIKTVSNYNELIGCDLKTCLGIAAGVGLNFNAWKIPLFLELKGGITLTETGIPPDYFQRKELFISINLNYLLRLKKISLGI